MVRGVYFKKSKPRDELTGKHPVDVQRVQDSYRPDGHRRTQKRSVHHRCPQIRGPVRLILYNSQLPYQHFVPRYLNIRLDAIKVQNPDQHPHMVNAADLYSHNVHYLPTRPSIDGCQELLYSRIGRPIRSAAGERYGHPTARGRHTKR